MDIAAPPLRGHAAGVLPAACLAGFVALGIYGSTLGWGTDRDSLRVIDAATAILHGHYQRSRSFGFPLHEAASAVLYAVGGLCAVNLGSLAVTLVGIFAALRVALILAPERVGLAALALCGSPLLLVNASAAIDFNWDFAAGMALLWCALAVQRTGPCPALLVWVFVGVAALILLRPDNLLFAAAVMGALCLGARRHGPAPYLIAAATLAAASGAGVIYFVLNDASMFATAVTTTRPVSARLARAAVLLSASLGPGGVLALLALARHRAAGAPAALLRRAAALSWLLYLPRFAALPDQMEYLILPVQLTILLAAVTAPLLQARLCVALVCVPGLVTLSLLARDPVTGALHAELAPQWGALPQDWAARRFAMRLQQPDMARYVAAQLAGPDAPAKLRPHTYLPGYVSPAGDLVIGRGELYHLVATHEGAASLPTVPRRWFRGLWACPYPLGPTLGWRAWEAPSATTILDQAREGAAAPCTKVDNTP